MTLHETMAQMAQVTISAIEPGIPGPATAFRRGPRLGWARHVPAASTNSGVVLNVIVASIMPV
jgi:hypothetical protein